MRLHCIQRCLADAMGKDMFLERLVDDADDVALAPRQCAVGSLLAARYPQFADQNRTEGQVQRGGGRHGQGDTTAGQAKDDRVWPFPELGESFGQAPAGFRTVLETHAHLPHFPVIWLLPAYSSKLAG